MMMMMMMRMTAGTSFGSAVNCLGNKKGEMTTLPPPINVLYYSIAVLYWCDAVLYCYNAVLCQMQY